ncbi:peptidase domain-containing ABC transporter [Flavobacterium sp. 3HN19-14]|uniref:peptidase domain-containing ABC transporter n=1 Tax=Flavobacterium sp. 3HN19-14 TaxID=3448133 RepID=UPI003EE24590
MKAFPFYKQADAKDCGPTCLKIVCKHYGKSINIQTLRELSETTREGSNLFSLGDAAEKIGFRTLGAKISSLQLSEVPLPSLLHWRNNHYVVLYKIKKNKFYISDLSYGLIVYTKEEFLKFWIGNNAEDDTEGVILLLEPTPQFYKSEFEAEQENKFGFSILIRYALPYKAFIIQLLVGLLAGSILQLLFPFLTQSIVDVGIKNQNIGFIYIILFAQLFLFFGKTALEFVRSWILLHLSTRINISLLSDFFIKLMSLPISFFDVRMTGDIMQRINDHQRIERILTTSSLSVFFSLLNIVILGGVLAYYNAQIFVVFFTGSLLYFLWVIIFLKRREVIDYKKFSEVSAEQSKVIELINGMQEIKLHNAERQKRWGWEHIQARLFKISMKGLALEQTQYIGSNFINELKNIIIIFLSAKLVIDGQITLGMMMAISSIVGSLNGPIIQFISFIREVQDAKISLARLSEIHQKEDENQNTGNSAEISSNNPIVISNMSFKYPGSHSYVLQNLNLEIPAHKITAIVGTSGSGKTTLMKLLLKFYEPEAGNISIGQIPLKDYSQKSWRNHVGAVMQEGYIFNDSIANNIAIGADLIDKERLLYAADVANIKDFIQNYPNAYNTQIGMEGIGMSTGQKQRILIARAVYKNPEMLFFDEATSALDTNNERVIMEKLDRFFNNKTVVIIAHRLSTVMNAHQIIVLDNGQIAETGNHETLIKLKGKYFELVKNQLQLGK